MIDLFNKHDIWTKPKAPTGQEADSVSHTQHKYHVKWNLEIKTKIHLQWIPIVETSNFFFLKRKLIETSNFFFFKKKICLPVVMFTLHPRTHLILISCNLACRKSQGQLTSKFPGTIACSALTNCCLGVEKENLVSPANATNLAVMLTMPLGFPYVILVQRSEKYC